MAKRARKQYFEGDLPMMCEYPGCDKHAYITTGVKSKKDKTKIRVWAKSELLRKLYNKVDGYVCSRHREHLMAENKQMSIFYYQDKKRKIQKQSLVKSPKNIKFLEIKQLITNYLSGKNGKVIYNENSTTLYIYPKEQFK